ncbi:MAG: hypothetical protein IT191_02120 [Microbacteriaceae bacterium]|nr:hypothetical protein [Microbacteriaceae bacterium]
MLRPFLVIGVGGSGGKTLRALRHAIMLRLEQVGWTRGMPSAWQMLHFDTPVVQDGSEFPMPMLPPSNYKALVAQGGNYENVHESIVFGNRISSSLLGDVKRMLPDPQKVDVILDIGAGQFRAVGRVPALSKLGEISKAVADAMVKMTAPAAKGELTTLAERLRVRIDGDFPRATVIVVTSIAGGSGAGQYLDVIEAAKERIGGVAAENIYSLLYAPDVFNRSDDAGGIAANALAAISETTNGFWTQTPSPASIALYNRAGLNPSTGNARDRVGAAFPFIVGRQNSSVAFDGQTEVYLAVAASVTAWMMDDKIQNDIDSYAAGNLAAGASANVLPDLSGLMRQGEDKPPFKSLGFGRVTLGRDRFVDYASERLTRAMLDRMLYAHSEEDPQFEQRTEEAWIEYRKKESFDRFIKDARLDEETEDRNDIIDALQKAEHRTAFLREFRKEAVSRLDGGFNKQGGLPAGDWQHRLLTTRNDLLPAFMDKVKNALKPTLSDWIVRAPDHLIDTVHLEIARNGIPVTVSLLLELSNSLRRAESELLAEAQKRSGWIGRLPGLVNEILSQAPNQESIRPQQDVIEDSLTRLQDTLEWEAEALIRQVASKLIGEFRVQFVDRLRETLASARDALLAQVNASKLADGRDNDYPFWPKRVDRTVPRKYTPAPNERLLIKQTAYPEEFERLVVATVGRERYGDAIIDAIGSLIRGLGVKDVADASDSWSTIEITRSWNPATTFDIDLEYRASNTSTPTFSVSDDLDVYLDRSRKWMRQEGKAFSSYIQQDLQSYFAKDELPPDEYRKRVNAYREAIVAAIGASEPLVKLNASLLSAVHGKELDTLPRIVFSSIPFKEGTELYETTKAALAGLKIWDDAESPKWFRDVRVDGIEVFSMSRFPYQAMVMDSVMDPIVRGWLSSSGSDVTRTAFWKWKRSRSLRESVPIQGHVFDEMVKGWYVAKILGHLKVDTSDKARGPKLEIWDSTHRTYVKFPHPLLYQGALQPRDYPGAVMESAIIAFALSSSESSLTPLRPYHILRELGGDEMDVSEILKDWVARGELPEGCPTPDAERAGRVTDTLEERRERVKSQIDRESEDFNRKIVEQDSKTSIYSYPVSWEIRESVLRGLAELRANVANLSVEDDGV